jgi:hypothetical protein
MHLRSHFATGLGIGAGFAAVALPLALGAVTLPHTFTNGTVADAGEVNANFAALESAVDALEAAQAGTVLQKVVTTSNQIVNMNTTTYTEVSPDYRVTITPVSSTSKILVEYSFSANTAMQSNTLFSFRVMRDPAGANVILGNPSPSGLRRHAGFMGRPGNGQDANDAIFIDFPSVDSDRPAGVPVTYGLQYRREGGGSGTIYINHSQSNNSDWGFHGQVIMTVTEIAQ